MIIKKVFSILFGLLLGYFLIRALYSQAIYHGPDSNIVKRQIFFDEETQQCYRFMPKSYVCPLYLLKNQSPST